MRFWRDMHNVLVFHGLMLHFLHLNLLCAHVHAFHPPRRIQRAIVWWDLRRTALFRLFPDFVLSHGFGRLYIVTCFMGAQTTIFTFVRHRMIPGNIFIRRHPFRLGKRDFSSGKDLAGV